MKNATATMLRFLSFRASPAELASLGGPHLALGFGFVWLAGVARNWDNPDAELARHLGIGSLAYVFALAALLTIVATPFSSERDWSVYRRVLTVVCLTAPPALLYGIPIERWASADTARNANYALLAFVAAWRVALWAFYLRRGAGLKWPQVLVCTLLPLSIIVGVVGVLGLGAAIMNGMAGVRDPAREAASAVAAVLFSAASLSFLPLLIAYGFVLAKHRRASG